MDTPVILAATRTATGAFLGSFKDTPAPQLGGAAIAHAVKEAGIKPEEVDECLMGCVLPAGIGQAPARQAALAAKLPQSVRCTTINRVCGSGLKTVMWGSQMIQTGDAKVVVAGGMENMSLTPYLLNRAREGYRLGNGQMLDSMIVDGLWDVYNDQHMGNCAELCAKEKDISRAEQDRYAKQSYKRALAAIESGAFKNEIVGVEVKSRKETKLIDTDEEPGRGDLSKFEGLRPAFDKEGTVTAANASSLSDGAAALVMTSESLAKSRGLKPLARILAQESHAQAPEWFTTAPIAAIEKLMEKSGLKISDVDLFEINEAFAVVALACVKGLGIDEAKVNVNGGAIALGHPLGASGARILTTLVHALRAQKKRYGVAGICIGGGEASAVLIEAIY